MQNNSVVDDDPYRAPRAGHQGGGHIIYEDVRVFSFSQRINRLRYACYGFTAWLVLALAALLFYILAAAVLAEQALKIALVVFFVGVAILGVVYFVALTIRRLHDVGKSGWWILLFLSPLAAIPIMLTMPTASLVLFLVQLVSPLFSLYLLVAEGESVNRYGTPNPPNSLLVSFFGGICWVLTVLSLLLQVTVVGLEYVAPEMLDKYLGHSSQGDIQQFEQLFEELRKQ